MTEGKTPELFYLAFNFLGPSVTLASMDINGLGKELEYMDYFKDFAVIKMTFETETEAKAVTRDFATKYKNNKTNFASKTLLDKSANELANFQDAYVLGYPFTSNKPTINKKEGDQDYSFGSQLSIKDNYQIVNKFGQKLNGLNNAQNFVPTLDLLYNRKQKKWMQRIGLVYGFDDNFLGGGSSGSMVINKEKEIIGIQHSNDFLTRVGYSDPLISEGFTIDGKIVFPAYNLIFGGAPKQVNSFKQSMQKYFKGKTSWLLGKL